jgi:hypothetical protein
MVSLLRALPLLLVLSLLLSSETAARVGTITSSSSSSSSISDADAVDVENNGGSENSGSGLRELAGGYGYRPWKPWKPYKPPTPPTPPRHSGHYYLKRPIDPSEHYHNYAPVAKPTDPYPVYTEPPANPTYRPTAAPYSVLPLIPIPGSPKPTIPPPPTFDPTTKPTPLPTLVGVEAPPTFSPFPPSVEIVLEENETEDKDDVGILKPTNDTIKFEPPSPIQLRIAEFALDGGEEFADPSSYQFAALKRVEAQVGAENMTDVKLMQYYSLYCIFESTNAKSNDFIVQSRAFGDGINSIQDNNVIPGWKITSGWMENDVDPCIGEWYGVSCANEQIVTLDLFDNGLTGNFAPEVVFLAGDGFFSTGAGSLVSLDIFNNELMSNNGDNSWMQDLGSQLGT